MLYTSHAVQPNFDPRDADAVEAFVKLKEAAEKYEEIAQQISSKLVEVYNATLAQRESLYSEIDKLRQQASAQADVVQVSSQKLSEIVAASAPEPPPLPEREKPPAPPEEEYIVPELPDDQEEGES